MEDVFYHQSFFYNSETICSKIINYYHNNLLVGYFGIINIKNLVTKKYFWPNFCQDVKVYVKGYDFCVTLKAEYYKSDKNFQSLLVHTHYQKNVFLDFVTDFLYLID